MGNGGSQADLCSAGLRPRRNVDRRSPEWFSDSLEALQWGTEGSQADDGNSLGDGSGTAGGRPGVSKLQSARPTVGRRRLHRLSRGDAGPLRVGAGASTGAGIV